MQRQNTWISLQTPFLQPCEVRLTHTSRPPLSLPLHRDGFIAIEEIFANGIKLFRQTFVSESER